MASAGKILMFPVGDWISGSDYGFLDIVYFGGSSYIAKTDMTNSTTNPATDTANWQILAHGYIADTLAGINGTDTEGLLGAIGATVTGQALIDELADRVATKLLPIANVVNNNTTNVDGYALNAKQANPNEAGSLANQISLLNSNLSERLFFGSGTALQVKNGTTWYRLQVDPDGVTRVYTSIDSGTTWTDNNVVTNSDLTNRLGNYSYASFTYTFVYSGSGSRVEHDINISDIGFSTVNSAIVTVQNASNNLNFVCSQLYAFPYSSPNFIRVGARFDIDQTYVLSVLAIGVK